MRTSNCLKAKKEIEVSFIHFLNEETNDNETFKIFLNKYNDPNNQNNWNNFNEKFYFIITILNNCNPNIKLYDKIERIIKSIEEEIKKELTNFELFILSKTNKLVLYILFMNKILIPDKKIFDSLSIKKIKKVQIEAFLFPEFKEFYDRKMYKKIKGIIYHTSNLDVDDPEYIKIFNEQRKSGVNQKKICELIRNDSIVEFITYVNKNLISLQSLIKPTFFEANLFLLKMKEASLIEYSAFYGSIEIFQYLKYNNVEFKPTLWLYATHSRNPELIHILEENKVEIPSNLLKELLKLHDFDMTNYFIDNQIINFKDEDLSPSIHYCNYSYYPKIKSNPKAYYYYSKCNYNHFIELIEKDGYTFSINFDEKMKRSRKIVLSLSILSKDHYLNYINYFTEIIIPSSIKKINDKAFYNMYCLKKVFISNTITSIGSSSFESCHDLEEVIFERHSCLTAIGANAFDECKSLKEINILSTVESIGICSFTYCESLNCVSFELPSSLKVIQMGCFKECHSLKNIRIPYSVNKIECYAFDSCNKQLVVYKPRLLNDLEYRAFGDCKSIVEY